MTEVWLIRHGESVSNANLPTIHPEESELTPRGNAEARQVVRAFNQKPDLIVVSPYLRARQTAVPTIQHFPSVPREEWPVYEFTYLDPRHYHGTTGTERMPFASAYWTRNDPLYKDGETGESFAELLARVRSISTRLQNHPADFIVVFSHGMFLRALLWSVLTGTESATAVQMRRYQHFLQAVQMPNCAICKMQFGRDDPIYFSGFDNAHLTGGSP